MLWRERVPNTELTKERSSRKRTFVFCLKGEKGRPSSSGEMGKSGEWRGKLYQSGPALIVCKLDLPEEDNPLSAREKGAHRSCARKSTPGW